MRTGVEQRLHGVRQHFTGHVVDIAFEQGNGLAGPGRRVGLVAHHHLHHIRATVDIACASAVAHAVHGHGRHRAEGIGQRHHQRHAGRGGQFATIVDTAAGSIEHGQQFGGRRCGVGQGAVGGADLALPHGDGAHHDAVDAQRLESRARTHDVDDGVERAHLVEPHIVGVHAMHAPLGFGERTEGALGAIAHPRR